MIASAEVRLEALQRDLPAFVQLICGKALEPWQERALARLMQGVEWRDRLDNFPPGGQAIETKPLIKARDIEFLKAISKQEFVAVREVPPPTATRLLSNGLIEVEPMRQLYFVTELGEAELLRRPHK